MKTYLNQKIDYTSLLGKVLCKRITINKKFTSNFIKQHRHLFIDLKNTKKVISANPNTNYLLLDSKHGIN